ITVLCKPPVAHTGVASSRLSAAAPRSGAPPSRSDRRRGYGSDAPAADGRRDRRRSRTGNKDRHRPRSPPPACAAGGLPPPARCDAVGGEEVRKPAPPAPRAQPADVALDVGRGERSVAHVALQGAPVQLEQPSRTSRARSRAAWSPARRPPIANTSYSADSRA